MPKEKKTLTCIAYEAICAVFGDTSVSKEETLSSLQELYEDIEIMIDALSKEI